MSSSHLLLRVILILGLVGCTTKDNPPTEPTVNVVVDGASPDRTLIDANKEVVLLKEPEKNKKFAIKQISEKVRYA